MNLIGARRAATAPATDPNLYSHNDGHLRPSLSYAFAGVPDELALSPDVRFRVVVDGQPRHLSTAAQDEVYRIGLEAIVNAYRHSRAAEIEMQIQYRSSELRLSVRDNGRGINPGELRWGRKGHSGLQGMRERAERIGARLRLLSKVAFGTEVELCVPGVMAFEPSRLAA